MDLHHGAEFRRPKLCGEETLVLRTSSVRQGPALASGERRSAHPAERLEVEKCLLHLGRLETEPGRDPVSAAESQEPHRVQSQRRRV